MINRESKITASNFFDEMRSSLLNFLLRNTNLDWNLFLSLLAISLTRSSLSRAIIIASLQLDDLSRGFSFKSKNKLNMSMGQTEDFCKEVINNYSKQDLKDIIKTFGEEEEASKISTNIIKDRAKYQINTTDQLVNIIRRSKKILKKIDESTKTFQAIRIFL